MQLLNTDLSKVSKIYCKLPVDPAGYGDVSCSYKDLALVIQFQYFDTQKRSDRIGVISFGYCISFFVIESSQSVSFLPPTMNVIYVAPPISFRERDFTGYCVEFSNSGQTYLAYAESCNVSL
jgi:hypothetical protein